MTHDPVRHLARTAAAAGLALLAAAPALAAGGGLAFDDPRLQSKVALQVAIPQVVDGGRLPRNYARDGRNLSPPISWTPGPPAVRGYVVIVQDPDAAGARPFVHWLAYDIARQMTSLPRGVHNMDTLTRPLGVEQGRNDHGGVGYTGPDVIEGAPAHHYHFQVFAVDRPLRTPPGADLATLERDMAGHVAARGELVATYTPPPTPRAPRDKDKPASDGAAPGVAAPGA